MPQTPVTIVTYPGSCPGNGTEHMRRESCSAEVEAMAERGDSQSQFNARADNAALQLRQGLQNKGREIADQASVEVGPDGKPPAPLPPEGSYMRQMIDQQQQQQQQRVTEQPSPAEQVGDQPPAGTVEQAIDGSQAPPLAQSETPQPEPAGDPLSRNAQNRIQDLIADLRGKDQDLQQAMDLAQKQSGTITQLQTKMEEMAGQYEQFVQANLDQLDPDTRMQVMQNSQLQEMVKGMEQRIMGNLMPHITSIEQKSAHAEMLDLSDEYPAFDVQIHGPLVDMFRGKNPNCTIRQAWQAVAEPSELMTRQHASVSAVPPVVPPGNVAARPRYQPEPQATSNPEQELVEEAQQLKKLRASEDPNDQKMGMTLLNEHLIKRLGL